MNLDATKICTRCKLSKSTSEFYPYKWRKDGLYPQCKSCKKAGYRATYLKHKEKRNAESRANYQKYRLDPKFLQRNKEHNKIFVQQVRSRVIAHYSAGKNCCACCGITGVHFLAIDHIAGGGRSHRKELKIGAGWKYYTWLIKMGFPLGFQVLCHNCNQAKGFYGACPHEREKLPPV